MLFSPFCFSTNLIFGKLTGAEVAPFTLAFLRWLAVACLLAPLVLRHKDAIRRTLASATPLLALLGFLGMWLCGGPVYLALGVTSATNGALIFTTTPIFIIILEAVFRGRRIGFREAVGSGLALAGVVAIVVRGDLATLLDLALNFGDLILIVAVIGWAIYSILCRSPQLRELPNLALLALAAGFGALMLAPFAAYEWAVGAPMPTTAGAFAGVAGIIIFPSLLAFSTHQFGMRTLGASFASIFMYLMPVYGVVMALVLLGEPFGLYQAIGIALVMAGVVLATLPGEYVRRIFRS